MNKIILQLFLLFCIVSCVPYNDYYKFDKNYLQNRQINTKSFNIKDKNFVLSSVVQTLQDLGFNISESEKNLGLITATKDKEINPTIQTIGKVTLSVLLSNKNNISNEEIVYDIRQKIYITVSIRQNNNGFIDVQILFAKTIWNNLEQSRIELINDKNIYKSFFDKLEQSLFLLKNNI